MVDLTTGAGTCTVWLKGDPGHDGSCDPAAVCLCTSGELLGAGSFGRVYKASWAGREVAVKVGQNWGSGRCRIAEPSWFYGSHHR